MKKKLAIAILTVLTAGMFTGCGKQELTIADLKNVEVEDYVEIPDYKNLDVPASGKVEITDADVKSYIHGSIDAVESMHELTGAVESGDVVNIDYAGTIDGTAFEGGTAQGQLLEIGSGSFIEGFEEGLIGVEVGETKDLSLKFPDNYRNTDVAGKDCIFAVKVNYILTPLSDDNVNLVDEGYTSAAAYEEDTKRYLEEYSNYMYETELMNNIASTLLPACTYKEIPQTLIDDYKEMLRSSLSTSASSAGMTLEQYVMSVYNVGEDGIESKIDEIALDCAKEGLALQAIANKEGISISDEELESTLSTQATVAGFSSVEEYLGEDADKEEIRFNILYQKVYDLLLENYK